MDLAAPIRTALVGESTVTANLSAYKGSFPVFTRRPAPADAPYPMILVSPNIQGGEEDGVNDHRPVLIRDVAVYGRNTGPADYTTVEDIAFDIRELFHRKRTSITVPGWDVVGVVADSPSVAPVDDEQTVGRIVTLTVQLARQN